MRRLSALDELLVISEFLLLVSKNIKLFPGSKGFSRNPLLRFFGENLLLSNFKWRSCLLLYQRTVQQLNTHVPVTVAASHAARGVMARLTVQTGLMNQQTAVSHFLRSITHSYSVHHTTMFTFICLLCPFSCFDTVIAEAIRRPKICEDHHVIEVNWKRVASIDLRQDADRHHALYLKHREILIFHT